MCNVSLVNQTRVLISPIDKRSATKGSGSRDLCNVINGHVEVEQAPFAPAIARCYQDLDNYLMELACLLSQAELIRGITVSYMTCMLN